MTRTPLRKVRCAVYTRKSSEEGLEQAFNSLDAQREACEAYIASQRHEGWIAVPDRYDDGGISGGTLDRPALQRLFRDVEADLIDVVVVYKIDRLTRALTDFAKLVELFDRHDVTFVSVTQQFNTTTSMGRLTLNIPLSFAQFEREVTAERIRDKVAASRRKGMWIPEIVVRIVAAYHDKSDGNGSTSAREHEVLDALGRLDEVWDELFPAEQTRIMRLLVERVAVAADGIDIRLRTSGIHSLVGELIAEVENGSAMDGEGLEEEAAA